MNMPFEMVQHESSLSRQARVNIGERASAAHAALDAAADDIVRFENLCDVLREHALEFEAEIYVSECGVQYWLRLHGQHVIHADEMMPTLSALGCRQTKIRFCEITERATITITGEHAPDFFLSIHHDMLAEAEHETA